VKTLYTWSAIAMVVTTSTAGDILLAKAMREIGDLGQLRRKHGIFAVVARVLGSATFLLALLFMTMAFFSLLIGLSWADVSLVGPAAASLTFVTNAVAARIFLKEDVDRRRWFAAILVAAGVLLIAH
jgi:drug/metabolite transporter (DMT)-like permease